MTLRGWDGSEAGPADGLRRVWAQVRARGRARLSLGQRLRAVGLARRLGVFGPRPVAPSVQAKLSGTVHSRDRDRAAITYHYDQSNDFYRLILDPSMAYSCAYWTSDDPAYPLEQAQNDKLDLICRNLGLRPGMRMLDVGCGWGSLTVYAARHFGVRVTAVTLAGAQRSFVADRVAELGLTDRVEVRLQVQQMSRGSSAPGGGAFIESYVAPDMHMRPVGETVSLLAAAGLEVRDVHGLREHYVRTGLAWLSTLEANWSTVVALVGEPMARVWRLYLVGGALTFEEGRMGVDQTLCVRPTPAGSSGVPVPGRDTDWR